MLTVENLTKVFGPVRAVDDLTFEVRPGLVTGFLGPNGAGKSTTMRMMLGLDRPTAGTATVDGRPYRELDAPLRQVGALLDASWIHPNRSARSHLRWMAASNGIPRRRVDEVLDMVGLASVAGKRAGGFSLGMKQRLGLAGAMLGDPHTLLFDEPVNGLDPEGIVWIRGFMRNLAAQGRTVLVSSHLLTEMSLTADHLVVIGQGKLIADCSVAEFTSRASSSVRVRSPQLDALHRVLAEAGLRVTPAVASDGRPVLDIADVVTDQVGDIAAHAGIVLHELTGATASLEEVFMTMTAGAVQYQGGGPAGTAAQGGPR
ncbi:ABC transporter ATP-binding protein [Gordonia sp. Z-3]|uniref:ABC transporter ATP-binding protein n=2 Tax=Gordonia TaxID=2053 RepID=A0A9X3D8L1_9ACTN|nr:MULTISPECIES: ABC transporter ATP-binding protein [Gordonia]MAU83472.1 export ABC transporter ATP-binding protein [Gordonia sp. (in: high G+C Gram-positive bacteria)]MCF3937251.1 ABC transporter ATP-binding protein [Gordonia tangerina]MCX2965647.1 ABC transporter ATP-binding protein [Gordonia aquimaris]MED5803666.1 ABC transporter ATP-binding protein [Gordonia sp. Z-3]